LQTLCSDALTYFGSTVVLEFDKISKATISETNQEKLRQILTWYKENYPIWFEWLEIR